MLTGYELFELKGLVEIEPLFSFKQDVRAGCPMPVRFLHGDHAIIGGTSDGRVNIWDIYSRGKQPMALGRKCRGTYILYLSSNIYALQAAQLSLLLR